MPQHLFFCSTRLDIWPVSCFFPLMNCVPQSFLVCISWCTYAGTMKLLSPRVEWSLLAVHSNPFSPSSFMKSTWTSFPDSLSLMWLCDYVLSNGIKAAFHSSLWNQSFKAVDIPPPCSLLSFHEPTPKRGGNPTSTLQKMTESQMMAEQ